MSPKRSVLNHDWRILILKYKKKDISSVYSIGLFKSVKNKVKKQTKYTNEISKIEKWKELYTNKITWPSWIVKCVY